jgi:hypothetical protein
MQTIISFVGADGCGKTHIAKKLSSAIGVRYFKASDERSSFTNAKDRFLMNIRYASPAILDIIKQTNSSIIFDRNYPCEYAYSKLYNRETDIEAIRMIDEEYSRLGHVIIHCYRKDYSNVTDDLDVSLTGKKLELLSSYYDDFLLNISKCKSFKLCVDDENLKREIKDILNFLLSIKHA